MLKLDVVSYFGPPMPTQPLGWFKNEIKSPDDLKGLKYRTVGLSADLFKELGVAVTILPGPEIVPALERGVIDGAEFNNPSSDKLLGFADIAKVLMVQSYHQPVEYLEFLVNKKKLEALPKDLQAIVKYAVMAAVRRRHLEVLPGRQQQGSRRVQGEGRQRHQDAALGPGGPAQGLGHHRRARVARPTRSSTRSSSRRRSGRLGWSRCGPR